MTTVDSQALTNTKQAALEEHYTKSFCQFLPLVHCYESLINNYNYVTK